MKSFADKETRKLFAGSKSRAAPPDLRERAEPKLAVFDAAKSFDDLKVPPGDRLEALRGDREGQRWIRINAVATAAPQRSRGSTAKSSRRNSAGSWR